MRVRHASASSLASSGAIDQPPLVVLGITSPETCLVLAERCRSLKAAGFRVVLVSSPGPLLERIATEEGIEPLAIPIRRRIAPLHDLLSLARLCAALSRLRPQLTEFSTPKAGLLGNVAAWWCGVPARIYMLRGLRLETLRGIKLKIMLAAERIASACAHHVVCNSESLRAKALDLRLAPAAKLKLIGDGSSHGVDVERFSPGPDRMRVQLGILGSVPVIGFVGRLTRDKGVPELIDAFERVRDRVPSARLLLVGWFDESEDGLSAELRARID
ncbi:MAG TPA: glycosyltransferase, partial [Terracidiphilus sp.]|nr:glycosyltransferase [Terracidiphilus sp.]